MERVDKNPQWRKIGGGTFRMASGKIIKKNQVFRAAVEDIPEAFRHIVVPIGELPKETPLEVSINKYKVQSTGAGWYNVIDGQDKVVNEKGLRQNEAQALIGKLTE